MRHKRSSQSDTPAAPTGGMLMRRVKEGVMVFTFFVAAFIVLSLVTYAKADASWSQLQDTAHIKNGAGVVGAWLSDVLLYMAGYVAYLVPLSLLIITGSCLYGAKPQRNDEGTRFNYWLLVCRVLGFALVLASGSAFCGLFINPAHLELPFKAGGVIGDTVSHYSLHVLQFDGSVLLLSAAFLVGWTLLTGLSWLEIVEVLGRGVYQFSRRVFLTFKYIKWSAFAIPFQALAAILREKRDAKALVQGQGAPTITRITPTVTNDGETMIHLPPQPKPENLAQKVKPAKQKNKALKIVRAKTAEKLSLDEMPKEGALPLLSLLSEADNANCRKVSEQELKARSREVELCLGDFGVEAKVVAVHPGPIVTRFEIDLAAGTKVSKIVALAKDLARSLSVMSVRVVEVIPGKSYIGLELPNSTREVVALKDVLSSSQYAHARSPLTLALGKDISGHPVIVDLAKMPHLLVAGTTGSGKSVGVNTMLMSLLYKSTPKDLRLILIDPKMLELSIYDDIPHLLAPVVTDMNDAATALRWCVAEMERRYKLMAALGVRNIMGYNNKVKEAQFKKAPLLDPLMPEGEGDRDALEPLPRIVVVADEFADMMVVVGKKVETLIARLAQKARAAGIHLILATQRPSVDVITGLIKANIPTRISFQVSSKVDSRTILDQQGAEQLLGHGDMLYLAPGSGLPVRVHGAFVSDDEVHRVVDYLKLTGNPDYLDAVLDDATPVQDDYVAALTGEGSSDDDGEKDSYYDQAVEFVAKSRRVSISSVQRRFKIGYNRAANIVEAMEAAGVVSSPDGSSGRQVLVPAPAE